MPGVVWCRMWYPITKTDKYSEYKSIEKNQGVWKECGTLFVFNLFYISCIRFEFSNLGG